MQSVDKGWTSWNHCIGPPTGALLMTTRDFTHIEIGYAEDFPMGHSSFTNTYWKLTGIGRKMLEESGATWGETANA